MKSLNLQVTTFCEFSEKKYTETINRTSRTFFLLFQAGEQRDGNAPSPPLIVGDSRYSTAKPKARRPLDPDPTLNTQKI
jgi:hypothetical protein